MKVILGVTGCIGAYKAALILRLLQKQGLEVAVVMTGSAEHFISPLTFEKLSGNPVVTDLFADHTVSIEHISLARESHLLLVAPATANIMGKFAHGIADDFLSTLYLSTQTPVVVAPAMNVEMWRHPVTRENVEKLQARGVTIVPPGDGFLACGEEGEGRLAEPEEIVQVVLDVLGVNPSLAGKKVIVTAGPTVEDIDPVRFISNRSSGKMGYELAAEAALRGARVDLVSGPTSLPPPPGINLLRVRSAAEMAQAVFERFDQCDIIVMAAAVSDFTPAEFSPGKIKKQQAGGRLDLKPTTDILAELGKRKNHQFLVGFAAESQELRLNAENKLKSKNLDLIVANNITDTPVFGSENNQVTLLDREGGVEETPLLSKRAVARLVWDRVSLRLGQPDRLTGPARA
jgi:phosphopantothenoylcysteine decarboxylase / phosphopantothenate---cysteine ligase